jgi:hypothetical protein
LVEVAVPNTLPNLIVRHWLNLLYLFEILLIVGGILFAESSIERFGFTTLIVTGAAHVALITLGRVMHGKRPWSRLALAIAAGLVAATLGVGAFALANGTTRATLWRELKAVIRPAESPPAVASQ